MILNNKKLVALQTELAKTDKNDSEYVAILEDEIYRLSCATGEKSYEKENKAR